MKKRVLESRECTDETVRELAKQLGYSKEEIYEVIDVISDFIVTKLNSGHRETIRLPKLGSFVLSPKRELKYFDDHEGGILRRRKEIGIPSNVNPEILEKLEQQFYEFYKSK